MSNIIQKGLNLIVEHFKKDTSKMLIVTGGLGWMLSSFAQIAGILTNKKYTPEEKSFLVPQELMDGLVNIIAFLGVTYMTRVGIAKFISTGKFAPKSVRQFLNKNESIYKNKVGKLDFNLDEVLKEKSIDKNIKESYDAYKNYAVTVGTIGASILSCNVLTPIIRNKTASKVQKNYIDMKQNPTKYTNSTGMKI